MSNFEHTDPVQLLLTTSMRSKQYSQKSVDAVPVPPPMRSERQTATTPGSGSFAMSVLWTTLPTELKYLILEKAIPDRLELQVTQSVPHLLSAPPDVLYTKMRPSSAALAEHHAWVATIANWKHLLVLLSVSQGTRRRALAEMKQKTCIHMTLHQGGARDSRRGLRYKDWFKHRKKVIVAQRCRIQFHKSDHRHDLHKIAKFRLHRGRIPREGHPKRARPGHSPK